MTEQETYSLVPGVYKVYWKLSAGGGKSLAAVGFLHGGRRWLAACHETGNKSIRATDEPWADVERVELIRAITDI